MKSNYSQEKDFIINELFSPKFPKNTWIMSLKMFRYNHEYYQLPQISNKTTIIVTFSLHNHKLFVPFNI